MSASLKEFCSLISDLSIKNSAILSERFKKCLELKSPNETFEKYIEKILFYNFSFMGWTLSIGVWTNLPNTNLRRDLMIELKDQIILKAGEKLSNKNDSESIATECSKLYIIFEKFQKKFKGRLLELNSNNLPCDANSTLLMTLEWIQTELKIPESVMNKAIPKFECNDCIADIEKIASQINIAAGEEG